MKLWLQFNVMPWTSLGVETKIESQILHCMAEQKEHSDEDAKEQHG